MRKLLLATSLVGFVLFSAAFLTALFNPILVERAARELVRIEVEKRVGDKVMGLTNAKVAGFAGRILGKNEADLAEAKRDLANGVSVRVARVVEGMLDPSCSCRGRIAAYLQAQEQARIARLTQVQEKLTALIEQAYASVSTNLIKEFRIVSASNAVAFAALWLVTFFRRRAALQLLLPAVVLCGAVGITLVLYLFNQNWLHTIVYAEYVGWGYSGYLAAVAALLTDVVFNRARITSLLVNGASQVVGAAAHAVPC